MRDSWELRYHECREDNAVHFRKINDLQRENEKLRRALKVAEEALESIANESVEDQKNSSYWMGLTHARSAAVIANDTVVAREALKQIKEINEK